MKRLIALVAFVMTLTMVAQQPATMQPEGLLQSVELQALVPATVYFSGQVATVQVRNSAGVRWSSGKNTLFAIVDTGGYSSALRERYQFYVISDMPIEIGGKRLPAGAYGAGFLDPPGMVVMDLGGNEVFHTAVAQDTEMKRPRPLQVIAGGKPGEYRLCVGRSYVTFRLADSTAR